MSRKNVHTYGSQKFSKYINYYRIKREGGLRDTRALLNMILICHCLESSQHEYMSFNLNRVKEYTCTYLI